MNWASSLVESLNSSTTRRAIGNSSWPAGQAGVRLTLHIKVEDAGTQALLGQPNNSARRRLGHMQKLARRTDIALHGNGENRFELAQGQMASHRLVAFVMNSIGTFYFQHVGVLRTIGLVQTSAVMQQASHSYRRRPLKTRLFATLACLFTFAGVLPGNAWAQAYPNKPITIVVPFSPGSGTDQVARGMARVIASAFNGATVVVDNKPGASGMIAAQAVAKAPADGYTLFMTTNTTQSANPHLFKKLSYDPVGDFSPIAAIARGSMVLALSGSSPINSVSEFIAAAKGKAMTFGAGNSSSRVAAEMFGQMTGTKTIYVPYKSNPQSVTDLVGGQLDFMFADTATALPLVQAGKLKAIGYAGDKRSPALANVPTLSESGINGYELYYWVAVYAPKGLAPELVRRLNEVLVKGVHSEVVSAVYAHAVLDPYTTSPDGLAQFQRNEAEKWGRVIRAAGIEAE